MTKPFVMTRRVQFVETDMAGVLHFSNYYRYMEEAECAFWRSLGLSVLRRADDREISWPRAATRCEYAAPARFEDELELALSVAKITDRTVTYKVEFSRDGQRIAVGYSTGVCCATVSGVFQPVPIPEDMLGALQPLRADGAPNNVGVTAEEG